MPYTSFISSFRTLSFTQSALAWTPRTLPGFVKMPTLVGKEVGATGYGLMGEPLETDSCVPFGPCPLTGRPQALHGDQTLAPRSKLSKPCKLPLRMGPIFGTEESSMAPPTITPCTSWNATSPRTQRMPRESWVDLESSSRLLSLVMIATLVFRSTPERSHPKTCLNFSDLTPSSV